MSTFGDGDVVRNLVDAGMAAIQSAVVNEGAEILKKNEKAKRYVKTGLNVMKALDSVVALTDEDPEQTTCRFQCPTNDRGVQGAWVGSFGGNFGSFVGIRTLSGWIICIGWTDAETDYHSDWRE